MEFPENYYDEDEFDEGSSTVTTTPPSQTQGGNLDNQEQNQPNENIPPSEEKDFTTKVLNTLGISDPSKIKFQDTTGAVIERDWNSLTEAEQLNIIAGNREEAPENDLSEDEIELLNAIRNSGSSVQDYLNTYMEMNTPQQPQQPSYKIDELSDDEVYALDLLEKVGSDNITDEEIDTAIANAKQNETLYKKTVEGLRNEYVRLQQEHEAQQANEATARQQAQYQQFSNNIHNAINGFNNFMGQDLELSQDEKEELAGFMLDLDDNGVSYFGKAMQDPKLFTKAAFWLLNEDKIAEEITKQLQDTYKRGYEQAKKDLNAPTSKLVFKKPAKSQDKYMDDEFGW